MKSLYGLFFLAFANCIFAQKVVVKNNKIERTLTFDGSVWRTTRFSSVNNKISIAVKSDEVNILGMDSMEGLSIGDFRAIAAPRVYARSDTNFVSIIYVPLIAIQKNEVAPQQMVIKYFAIKNESFIRKRITLIYDKPTTVDRLEVERFVVNQPASEGGRGEPVFVNNQWFFGLEYPAGYSRLTDGNTPKSYGCHFEKVGNYSFINLDGRDIEPHATKGMLHLMHFPGYAIKINHHYEIIAKTAVEGFALKGESVTQWNGLISTFYKPRWQMFINFLNNELKKDSSVRYKEKNINNRFGRPSNTANAFYNKMAHWEADWGSTHNTSLLTKPTGNEVELVNKFYKKWLPVSVDIYAKEKEKNRKTVFD